MCPGYEDDKVQLPFTVTDLKGRNLQLVTGPYSGQVCVCASVTVAVPETVEYISISYMKFHVDRSLLVKSLFASNFPTIISQTDDSERG